MRRADVLEVLDQVPTPVVEFGMYLVDILLQVGPVKSEAALTEADLEPWERRRGIELKPWQAEMLVMLSQEYLMEMHQARQRSALCPWPAGRNMWKYVTDQLSAGKLDAQETPNNGNRQRHRNPAPR